jgi:hypothetical protein
MVSEAEELAGGLNKETTRQHIGSKELSSMCLGSTLKLIPPSIVRSA